MDAARDYANQAKDAAKIQMDNSRGYMDSAMNRAKGLGEEIKEDIKDYAQTDRDYLGVAKVTHGTQQDNAVDQVKHFVEAAGAKVDDSFIPPEAGQDFTS